MIKKLTDLKEEKKTLYLECNSGISGDMMAAALIDLGADKEVLEKALKSLPVDGFDIKISRVNKCGLDICDFAVLLNKEHENHDHDMEYLHGKNSSNEESADYHHEQNHHHEGHYDVIDNHTSGEQRSTHYDYDEENHHHHEHRGLNEIAAIIDEADMTDGAKKTAAKIFNIIAEAEAEVHGVPKEEVHFHEVGAVDSIVDITAISVCLDNLDIDEVIIPELCEGKGTVRCQHGILPIPVPAVTNIVSSYDITISRIDVEGEFITPTGAAIAAAICTSKKLPQKFNIKKVGTGAGKRNYERPSMLRAMIIESSKEEDDEKDYIYKLESNIDDCSGETLGNVMNLLFEGGARDVHYMPVYMKKNRPAYQLNVICDEEHVSKMENIIFKETTTIGIRKVKMERTILKREIKKVNTSYGEVEVKVCEFSNQKEIYPEYESLLILCRKFNIPYAEMYKLVLAECVQQQID